MEFGEFARGLTDMTTMPLFSLRGNLLLVLWSLLSTPLVVFLPHCRNNNNLSEKQSDLLRRFPSKEQVHKSELAVILLLYFYPLYTTNGNSMQQGFQLSCG